MDPNWHTDPAFWAAVEPVLFGRDRERDAQRETPAIVAALGLTSGDKVLDVFCGSGRHLRAFAKSGLNPVGVDRTPAYLSEVSRLRTAEADLSAIRVFEAALGAKPGPQLREFDGGGEATSGFPTVDGATWLGASFGYEGQESDVAVLQWIRSVLRPGGRILIEGPTTEDLEAVPFRAFEWFDEAAAVPEETEAVWRLEHRLDAGWLEGRWRRFREGHAAEVRFRYRIYRRAEWLEMLCAAGFSAVRYTHDLEMMRWSSMDESTAHRPLKDDGDVTARSWITAIAGDSGPADLHPSARLHFGQP